MGFYLGYAMSLFGREQDRVSHVLVSEGFTDHRDFFFKPQKPITLRNAQGWEMSTADARIYLAEIPIVRLRSTEFSVVSDRKMGFADAVARANRMAAGTEFRLKVDRSLGRNAGRGVVTLNGAPLKLQPSQVAFVHWLARRRLFDASNGGDGYVSRNAFGYERNNPKGLGYLNEILGLVTDLYGEMSDVTAKVRHSLIGEDGKGGTCADPIKWLDDVVGGINRRIKALFGQEGVKRYGVVSEGKRGAIRYRLAITPEHIHLEE